MQISLDGIVDYIADRVGFTFSIPIQQQLKFIVNYKRAQLFQQMIEKRPEMRKYFIKEFSIDLVEVPNSECPVDLGCTVLRTSLPIPYPVRTSYALFDYVGTTDKTDGYTYTAPEQLSLMIKWGSKYTSNRPKYFYSNKYIYIYNEDNITNINIRGMWTDPRDLMPFKCAGQLCYSDSMPFDIPEDLFNSMMRDILQNEIKLFISPEKDVVEIDKDDKANVQKE